MRKPKRYRLRSLLKRVRSNNLHPEIGLDNKLVSVPLDTFQIAALKTLARENGTTLGTEIDKAVDAYVLDISRREINRLYALVDELERSTARAEKALDEALREVDMATKHRAKKRRTGSSSRAAKPKYPADDGPLSEKQIAAIRKLAPQGMMSVKSSLFGKRSRAGTSGGKPGAPVGRRRKGRR